MATEIDIALTHITVRVCIGGGGNESSPTHARPTSTSAQASTDNREGVKEGEDVDVVLEAFDFVPREKAGGGEVLFVVTPGNPGIISYYKEYLAAVFNGFDGKHRVLGVGNAGHSKSDLNDKRVFGLEDQVDIRIALVEDIHEQSPHAKIVLCGHSVGAYLNMQVETRRPSLPIVHTQLLFPTICHLNLAYWTQILTKPLVTSMATTFIWLVPDFVKSTITQLFVSGGENEARLAMQHAHPDLASNVLTMAREEHANVNELSERCEATVKSREAQSSFIFTEGDPYVSLSLFETLRAKFPGADMTMHWAEDNIKHAFVLADSEKVAEWSIRTARPHIERVRS